MKKMRNKEDVIVCSINVPSFAMMKIYCCSIKSVMCLRNSDDYISIIFRCRFTTLLCYDAMLPQSV